MISQREINRRAEQFKKAGEREKINPPAFISMSASKTPEKSIDIRRAKLTASAGTGSTITANLYSQTGIEQTTGAESGITIYCNISNGTNLNEASRRLASGDELLVCSLSYDNNGTLEYRWYALEGFQAVTEDCTCVPE